MLSKKENAKKFLTENLPLFACPKCQKDFTIKDNQLVCQSGHSFEISKKGTVYFTGVRSHGLEPSNTCDVTLKFSADDLL